MNAYFGELTVQQIDELISQSVKNFPTTSFRKVEPFKKTSLIPNNEIPKTSIKKTDIGDPGCKSFKMPPPPTGYIKGRDNDPL